MRQKRNVRTPGMEPRFGLEPRGDGYGPQGSALIMELQRLRQAFDDDDGDPRTGRRGSRDGAGRNRRQPSRRSKRKKKGTVERALDICLRPFGLRTAMPEYSRGDTMQETAPLQRRRSSS